MSGFTPDARFAKTRVAAASPIAAAASTMVVAQPAAAAHFNLAAAAFDRSLLTRPIIMLPPMRPASLPMLSSRAGSLFADRNDTNLHWYLPSFSLAPDIDAKFAFAASQSGQDADGNPFYSARLTLQLCKSQPDDVVAFAKSNPAALLREVPLAGLDVVLTSLYTADDGGTRRREAVGTVEDAGNGNYAATFEQSVLGPFVLGLYQDLTVFGKAQVLLRGSFQAWAPPARPQSAVFHSAMMATTLTLVPAAKVRTLAPMEMRRIGPLEPPPSPPPLLQTTQQWSQPLALALKYAQDGYQLKYTVHNGQAADHVIRDANDLRDFAHGGSEFRELKALGDLGQKYPTLSRAYFGVLSRTIIVVPARYAIVRSHAGCAAQCLALVDSAPSNASKCKFEFDFTVAPEISAIEYLQFVHEVAHNAELSAYKIKFPDFLQDSPASTLLTGFASQTRFASGSEANTFAISAVVSDADVQTPAVANANLFITQLCASNGADLVGSLNLKLDDAYTKPVTAKLLLNFANTTGTDEMTVQRDEAAGQLVVTNRSPIDLRLSRYAVVSGDTVDVVPAPNLLAAGATFSIPLPADPAALVVVEAQVALPVPAAKSDVMKLLTIQAADVQTTQYVVAVDVSGVSFATIDAIRAEITFANLPGLATSVLRLNKDVRADSTHVVIPIESAVFSLPGSVCLTVSYIDRTRADGKFTMQHDFTERPVLVIDQNDIAHNLPGV